MLSKYAIMSTEQTDGAFVLVCDACLNLKLLLVFDAAMQYDEVVISP